MKRKGSYFSKIIGSFLIIAGTLTASMSTCAAEVRQVRVGFFAIEGYHEMDTHGNKSGYGYELLQMMNRHSNWRFEYVGFHKSWPDMLKMLDNGEIDLITITSKTPQRLNKYAFSQYSVGANSMMLTTQKYNENVESGNYATYNNLKIGLLIGNHRNKLLEEFASQNNFTYQAVYYKTGEELAYALKIGKEINAAFTTNLRVPRNERILEEFGAEDFFIITRKDDFQLMSEINAALRTMNFNDPNWRSALRLKYYNTANDRKFRFSEQDKRLIERLHENKQALNVLVNTTRRPYAYLEDGNVKGILPDLFEIMAKRIDLPYKYVLVHDDQEYQRAFLGGAMDIVLDGNISLQDAEYRRLVNCGYMLNTPISMITRRDMGSSERSIVVQHDLLPYARRYFGETAAIFDCETTEKCLDYLRSGKFNTTLMLSQSAEQLIETDYRNEFMASVVPNQSMPFSLLTKEYPYAQAPSLLAKACASITASDIEAMNLKHKNQAEKDLSITDIFYLHPHIFLGVSLLVILLGSTLTYILWRRKKEIDARNASLLEANEFLQDRDAVTKEYNRHGFIRMMEKMRDSGTDLTQYSVIFVDIKGIKAINEFLGPDVGDEIFRLLCQAFNDSDLHPELCARAEADHFVFLVKNENLDYKLLASLLTLDRTVNEKDIRVYAFAGIYKIAQPDLPILKMVAYARLARQHIDKDYANSYLEYNPNMRDDYYDQMDVLSNFEHALANKEFQVYYQPIVHVQTGRIASAEALIRWRRGNGKMVSPGVFVPVLEKYGYISKVDAFVDTEVRNFLLARQDAGKKVVPISVNLSWMDFYDNAFTEHLLDESTHQKLQPGLARYEITETAYAVLESNYMSFLDKMQSNGVEIVLDDFGSGYSSFGMMQNFHFNILKLDMSFIRQIMKSEKVCTIVKTIIELSHHLQMRVVAEGVEHEEEVKLLQDMHCDYIQGYYFSKPLSQEEFEAYLAKEAELEK